MHGLFIKDSTALAVFPLKATWSLTPFVPELDSKGVQRLSILPKVTAVMEIKSGCLI